MAKKKLTPKQKRKQRLAAPLVPGSSMTLADAIRGRKAAVKLQYGPQEHQLAQTGRNIDAWFPGYQQELTRLNNLQQQRYATAANTIAANAAQAQAQQSGSNQALQSQLQADAASRGATYSGAPTQQSQQASNIGQDLANAFAAAITGQGTAYSGYTSGQQGVASAAQLGARQKNAADKTTLKASKGAYAQNYMDTTRANEQKSVLESAAFGLKQQTESDINAAKKASRVVSRKNTRDRIRSSEKQTTQRVSAQQQAKRTATRERAAADERKHVEKVRETSAKGLGRIHDAIGRWNVYAGMRNPKLGADGKPVTKGGKAVTIKPTPSQLKAQLLKEGFTGPEVHLALMIRAGKSFTPSDVALAHELGIRVPRKYIQSKPKGTRPSPLAPGANGQNRPT